VDTVTHDANSDEENDFNGAEVGVMVGVKVCVAGIWVCVWVVVTDGVAIGVFVAEDSKVIAATSSVWIIFSVTLVSAEGSTGFPQEGTSNRQTTNISQNFLIITRVSPISLT
jgi:hypothetical protein